MVGIYKIENPKGRIYIGQSKDIEVRWRDYRSLRCKGQRKLYYSLNKYGIDRHIFTVQEECELSVLNEKERYWQEYYKVLEGGLNLEINKTTGERKVISEETRERMSAAQRGKTLSDSTKEKISISGKAREYRHTDLAKEAISTALKKRIRKEETTTKIVEKLKGQKRTDASKKRMSQAHTGIKDTDATREAKSAAAKAKKNAGNPQSCKTIWQYSADGEFIREWKSITQAAKEHNTSVANLSVAIKKNRLRVGYFWKNNEYYKHMIQKGANILSEHAKKRLDFKPDLKQINFLDRRVYQRSEGVYYPSVTSVLQYMPKNKFFENWLKDVGHNSDIIMRRAGDEGTQTHNAIEELLEGKEISWMDDYGNARYNELVWGMILKFKEFWDITKPELILLEEFTYSDTHKYAGTADLVIKMNGETWLIDFKTSNSLHKSYELQLAAYAKSIEEAKGIKIDRTAILWLKAATRGEDKSGKKVQGKGWELKVIDNIEENFELFKLIYRLYQIEHPTTEPKFTSYPTTIKL